MIAYTPKMLRLTALLLTATCLLLLAALTSQAGVTAPATISDVQVSNLRDVSATISWLTGTPVTGTVRYSTNPANLDQLVPDDRGGAAESRVHHATLTGLTPETTYYFDVMSGSEVDDNSGGHYQVATGPVLSPPGSDLIWGQVFESDGVTPASDVLVFLRVQDGDSAGSSAQSALLSGLTDAAGYWQEPVTNGAVNLATARSEDGAAYFSYSPAGDRLRLEAVISANRRITAEVDTANDSPAAAIVLPDPADLNGDGAVDVLDVQAAATAWNDGDLSGDVDGDGDVDIADVQRVAGQWAQN